MATREEIEKLKFRSRKMLSDYDKMKKAGLRGAKHGMALGESYKRFRDKPSIFEWFSMGVQCGKSAYLTAFIKYLNSEEIYQRPYRHMWE